MIYSMSPPLRWVMSVLSTPDNVDFVDNVHNDNDLFYVPTDMVGNVFVLSTSRSHETLRRAEALAFARDSVQGFPPRRWKPQFRCEGIPPLPHMWGWGVFPNDHRT